MATASVEVTGLRELVRELRGPAFRDVNRELRAHSRTIATDLAPLISSAVARSNAPQAAAMAATVRVHSDRVPVVVVGKTNPRFASGFGHKGESAGSRKLRRGSLAHGVVYGPLGGRSSTAAAENYYRIARDPGGGPLGQALRESGPIFKQAADLYCRIYLAVLRAHGWTTTGGR